MKAAAKWQWRRLENIEENDNHRRKAWRQHGGNGNGAQRKAKSGSGEKWLISGI
jgi:hypothetical protein